MKNLFKILVFFIIINSAYSQKEIAITIDDLVLAGKEISTEQTIDMNKRIIDILKKYNVTSVGFVNEAKLMKPGTVDRRLEILRDWLRAGQELGNHTYSHPSLHSVSIDEYQKDIIHGEVFSQLLCKEFNSKLRYFRHPFLHTGLNEEVNSEMKKFFDKNGYTIAPVTIESSDWIFNVVYLNAKLANDTNMMNFAVSEYVNFTSKMVDYFEKITDEIIGGNIKHIFLCHDNELNADNLDKIFELLKQKGYKFISLETALSDEVYQKKEVYFGKMGISWIHRWNNKNFMELIKTEPDPPQKIMEYFKEIEAEK